SVPQTPPPGSRPEPPASMPRAPAPGSQPVSRPEAPASVSQAPAAARTWARTPQAPAAATQAERKPAEAEKAPPAEAPLDLDLVPALMSGVRLAELSLTGLMMDDLFLVSQIDGKSSVRELMGVTQMTESNARKVMQRLVEQGYVTLQNRAAARLRLKD